METLKRGSRGDAVRKLQRTLHITVDGVFGATTEEAVKAFQSCKGLVVDGIVGARTWKELTPVQKPPINIVDAHINTHLTYLPNRVIKYIVIHYTAGSTSKSGSARNTRSVFLSRNASADFLVDDVEVVQINPDICNYYCWSVGDNKKATSGGAKLYGIATNKNTINIEICSNLTKGTTAASANHKGWYFTPLALNNAIKLVQYLMQQYEIPKTNVVRHYDISGKLCPGILGWNDAFIYSTDGKQTTERNNSADWETFLKSL